MKLTFPGGEHPHVELDPGVQRIGSDPDSHIVLSVPGVQPLHCELHVSDKGVMVQVPGDASVSVNGRPVAGLIALRNGDHLDFHHVHAKLIAIEARHRMPATANDDPRNPPGIVILDRWEEPRRPAITAFIWGGKVSPTPALP